MQVLCGHCGRSFPVADELAGRHMPCPGCGGGIDVPRLDAPPEPAARSAEAGGEEEGFASEALKAISHRARISCGHCGKRLLVAMRRSGQQVRCVSCGQRIQVPRFDEADEEQLSHLMRSTKGQEIVEAVPVDERWREPGVEEAEVVLEEPGQGIPEELLNIPVAPRVRRRSLPLVGILAGGTSLAIGLAVLVWVVQEVVPWESRLSTGRVGTGQPSSAPEVPQPVPAYPPQVVGTAPSPESRPVVQTPPVPEPARGKMTLVNAACSVFAVGGYYPARPDRLYWKVSVEIQAGTAAVSFDDYGPDVILLAGGQEVQSLGQSGVEADAFPVCWRRGRVAVSPRSSQTASFLFDVPQGALPEKLKIAGLGEVALSGLSLPAETPEGLLAGEYEEQPPRNLKPLLADPVMAAVQSAGAQAIRVRRRGEEFDVELPACKVAGTARGVAPGLFEAVLNLGDQSLACKLRLAEGSDLLVLYLSDEPFHQMTFRRKG